MAMASMFDAAHIKKIIIIHFPTAAHQQDLYFIEQTNYGDSGANIIRLYNVRKSGRSTEPS